MKKLLVLIIIILVLSTCKYFRGDNCNNTMPIVGTYENIYDKKAENILIIKNDGTFEQFFKKEDVLKKNSGTWKFFKESCNIRFKNLKLLHDLSTSNSKFFKKSGTYRLNNIVFVEGLSYEFNYYRTD
ncbi:hypothetical protein [uncultured Polaribacter sp.]|uniref:hypothetical protein n=1 Tax=uncultured Polaribacter sp. TaxID=174711 RepID=UPI00262B7336|nr:hypothetical protein [uncultured Polaribacter sp.]